ncbi:aminoglycoside phosphotransferase family protein [Streptomyces spinoverrucosus]|uniref:phosphotransferase n=1 Tax=Streptomyces spinoverrucosus TaxID=284043 RepID=UPI0018C3DC86|nr:phosphotransferase [Streptomyces spinoverrucosus]MBG0854275.1 aminoglycoside phosphotransferase family protein [Streptomyces spinoverrucosus]
MAPESASIARLHAVEVSGDSSVVEGPLQGYHHETYVIPLPGTTGRWKCREPRSNLEWFDRRCFASEEQLLTALAGRIPKIPDIIEVGGFRLQRFIEGHTLGTLHRSGHPVPDVVFRQIAEFFGQLVDVGPETLLVKRRCKREDRPEDGDTEGFLERLVCFTEERVYEENLKVFEGLFGALGLDEESFKRLRKHVSGLRLRPFSLLHADLHRENFIVDSRERLWTIDWELAMVGDPLYDLATHLYLMRYPKWQEHQMAVQWRAAVEKVRPGASNGMERDLALLIDYKRAQSVFTDVIRVALALDAEPDVDRRRLGQAGLKLRKILAAAAVPLGLESVPGVQRIATALMRWHRAHGRGSTALSL